jgi:uncharacterized protein
MGYREIDIKIPVFAHSGDLKMLISKSADVRDFSFHILKKSLDARNKNKICWQYRVGVLSTEIAGENTMPNLPTLVPEFKKKKAHIVIVGSGPAGIFSALFLTLSGFTVTLIERGSKVETRRSAILNFESGGQFNPINNYAFGEGGAGTFSDGKLTSRTKSINRERNFIFDHFIKAGAPEEISYMTHPHLGTDNLFRIAQNFRKKLQDLGCILLFENQLTDLKIKEGKVVSLITSKGSIEADYFILAIGHSAFETYRMLINRGVPFQLKNFAIGFRAEHKQEIINLAQWGVSQLPGVPAAEYRLTAQLKDNTPVYSFCMCPGGMVVPAAAYAHTNIVNGMSFFNRGNPWANAAVVAGLHLEKFLKRPVSASEALDWLENIESGFYQYAKGYSAPATTIESFLNSNSKGNLPTSSYSFPLIESDFRELLPSSLIEALKEGLRQFCSTLKGYNTGIILGLESKTSSPIQVKRDQTHLNAGFENLFIAGEGSGWAGGIISSAADGLKISQRILVDAD